MMTPETDQKLTWINPGQLLNRKRLFTTQFWIDMVKLGRAIKGEPSFDEEPPSGWIWTKGGKECYVIGDGNHRVAYAIMTRQDIPFRIIGEWPDRERKRPYGFNKIYSQVSSELYG